jgi:hypothetical protein
VTQVVEHLEQVQGPGFNSLVPPKKQNKKALQKAQCGGKDPKLDTKRETNLLQTSKHNYTGR